MVAFHNRFGPIAYDLAASAQNKKHPNFFSVEDNSLVREWHKIKGNLWLNPPFEDITPWVKKCAIESSSGANIFLLVPASIGSEWFRFWVEPYAYVFGLNPRLQFVGTKAPYPKDLILAHYSSYMLRGFTTWRWK